MRWVCLLIENIGFGFSKFKFIVVIHAVVFAKGQISQGWSPKIHLQFDFYVY